mmetsp:Transcript_41857/g.126439  ORF Transcript_41857/g.126439 Transcript_41857/m.126439 type:complete len:253 (-) Transcript_41857:922-1680(-)
MLRASRLGRLPDAGDDPPLHLQRLQHQIADEGPARRTLSQNLPLGMILLRQMLPGGSGVREVLLSGPPTSGDFHDDRAELILFVEVPELLQCFVNREHAAPFQRVPSPVELPRAPITERPLSGRMRGPLQKTPCHGQPCAGHLAVQALETAMGFDFLNEQGVVFRAALRQLGTDLVTRHQLAYEGQGLLGVLAHSAAGVRNLPGDLVRHSEGAQQSGRTQRLCKHFVPLVAEQHPKLPEVLHFLAAKEIFVV